MLGENSTNTIPTEGADVSTRELPSAAEPPVLVLMIAKTVHGKKAWRAADSRTYLQAKLPNRPFPSITRPAWTHPKSVHAIRFYGDSAGLEWEASSVEVLAPPQSAPVGPLQFRHQGDRFEVELRQPDGQPSRERLSLGSVGPGEGVWVDVNWRMQAKWSGGEMIYVDTVTCALWPADDWEMCRPSDVAADLSVRTVDLREVLH